MQIHRAPNLSSAPHGFFGREGGVSTGIYESLNCGLGSRDQPEAVAENRRLVVAALAPGARLATVAQIHGSIIHTIDADWDGTRPEGDGLVTTAPGIALGILTADCAPVLFADAKAGVIGAAHAGWKGALGSDGAACWKPQSTPWKNWARTVHASRQQSALAFPKPITKSAMSCAIVS